MCAYMQVRGWCGVVACACMACMYYTHGAHRAACAALLGRRAPCSSTVNATQHVGHAPCSHRLPAVTHRHPQSQERQCCMAASWVFTLQRGLAGKEIHMEAVNAQRCELRRWRRPHTCRTVQRLRVGCVCMCVCVNVRLLVWLCATKHGHRHGCLRRCSRRCVCIGKCKQAQQRMMPVRTAGCAAVEDVRGAAARATVPSTLAMWTKVDKQRGASARRSALQCTSHAALLSLS